MTANETVVEPVQAIFEGYKNLIPNQCFIFMIIPHNDVIMRKKLLYPFCRCAMKLKARGECCYEHQAYYINTMMLKITFNILGNAWYSESYDFTMNIGSVEICTFV